MTLRDRLSSLVTSRPLFQSPDEALDARAMMATAPGSVIPPQARVCISVRRTGAFLKLLAALDGHASALLLASPSLPVDMLRALASSAGADIIVSDRPEIDGALPISQAISTGLGVSDAGAAIETQWIMTTSGTTGVPKMVPHNLASLGRTVRPDTRGAKAVWGLLYEPSRFAGLQVVLQSLLGGGLLTAPDREAELGERLRFLRDAGCTHLSATPTLWRRMLMDPDIGKLPLRQITLGGEIADEPLLRMLAATFPATRVTHVYASTEAGVGFSVKDGRAGFPLAMLDNPPPGIALRVRDGSLWVKAEGRRPAYLGSERLDVDEDGFIDSFDRIEIVGDRAMFLGRDNGSVNVAGTKVFPEQVENVINAVPGVALAKVDAKRSPIAGALLVATVVPVPALADVDALRKQVLLACREKLPREAVPSSIKISSSLVINAAGKLARG